MILGGEVTYILQILESQDDWDQDASDCLSAQVTTIRSALRIILDNIAYILHIFILISFLVHIDKDLNLEITFGLLIILLSSHLNELIMLVILNEVSI